MCSSAFYILDIPVYTCAHADFLQDTTTHPDNCTANATCCVKGQQKGLSGEVALAYQNAKYWGEWSKTQLFYVTKLETFKAKYIILMFQYTKRMSQHDSIFMMEAERRMKNNAKISPC